MTQPLPAQTGPNGANGNGHAVEAALPAFRCDRLVVARRRLGMSQGELAARLGVDQSTVSRLERGEMQSPPWRLVVLVCAHLQLEPHALIDTPPTTGRTCRPVSQVRARISHHFLHLGQFPRLPEMLHHCLYDMGHVRPTAIGVSLLLFSWPNEGLTRQYYAQWQDGQMSFAERAEPKTPSAAVARLMACWRSGEVSRRTTREERIGWHPALAIDVPIAHGMLGVDFMEEEEAEPDTVRWVQYLAETMDHGLELVGQRGNHGHEADMRTILARLAALEERLQ